MSPQGRRANIVALPVFNEEANLASLLDFLLTDPDVDAIVAVDDRSTDASPEILAAFAARDARVRFYTSRERGGQLAAWRLAATRAEDADALCYVDADSMPAKGAVGELFRAVRQTPHLVIASGRVVPDAPSAKWPAARFRARAQHELRSLGGVRDAIIGRFFVARKDWFLATTTRLDIIANDTYLSASAVRAGLEARYVPSALCYYGEAQTLYDFAAQRQRADAGYMQLRAMGVLRPEDEPSAGDYVRLLLKVALIDPIGALAWSASQIRASRLKAYRVAGHDQGTWEVQPTTKKRIHEVDSDAE